ncbi:hypothetical protein [Phyllobacterium sp. K27]
MAMQIAYYNPQVRAREKQVMRDRDESRLQSNSASRVELKKNNSFFSALPLDRFRIVAVGGKAIYR